MSRQPQAGDRLMIPPFLMRQGAPPENHYLLMVLGDTLLDDGIFNGDLLVLLRAEPVSGDVVLVNFGELAAVRRLIPQPGRLVLWSLVSGRPLIEVPADQAEVRGVVTGLVRSYAK